MAVFVIEGGNFEVVIHTDKPTDTLELQSRFEKLGAKEVELGKGYTAVKHKPHTTPGFYHVHVYRRKNELFAINQDGTAHDASHGVQMPNHVLQALQKAFPGWQFPSDGKIAGFDPSDAMERTYLVKLGQVGAGERAFAAYFPE